MNIPTFIQPSTAEPGAARHASADLIAEIGRDLMRAGDALYEARTKFAELRRQRHAAVIGESPAPASMPVPVPVERISPAALATLAAAQIPEPVPTPAIRLAVHPRDGRIIGTPAYTLNGKPITAAELAALAGCTRAAMQHRLTEGRMSPEAAVAAGARMQNGRKVWAANPDDRTGGAPLEGQSTIGSDVWGAIVAAKRDGITSAELIARFPGCTIKSVVHYIRQRYGKPVFMRRENNGRNSIARYWASEDLAPPAPPAKPKREKTIAPGVRIRTRDLEIIEQVEAMLTAAAPAPVPRETLLALHPQACVVGRILWRLRRSGRCFARGNTPAEYWRREADMPELVKPEPKKPGPKPKPLKEGRRKPVEKAKPKGLGIVPTREGFAPDAPVITPPDVKRTVQHWPQQTAPVPSTFGRIGQYERTGSALERALTEGSQ